MSHDKDDTEKFRVLSSLREMLGLEGDSFISAMREAVWVPGGVDQLADIIVRSLSTEDVYRLTRELPNEPEVMALVGRLLVTLNDHPEREALGQSVIARARKLGPKALHYLSPYSWYPPTDEIATILVSPYRLHSSSLMMRMQWGGSYDGIEAVWMIRFGAGDIGEAYFITEELDKAPFVDMKWVEVTMDEALSLITAVGMVQSAVNNRFPFDGMTGVGLWMVLAGGREVRPWIDGSFVLEAEELSPEEVALAEMNALNAGDFLAAYDLLMPEARPEDVLDYIGQQVAAMDETGDLWRLHNESAAVYDGRAILQLRAWYRVGDEMIDRILTLDLVRGSDGHWRIHQMDMLSEEAVEDSQIAQYLARHMRYYAVLSVYDMEGLAELLPGPPNQQTARAIHFSAGPDFDYRCAFDIGNSQDLMWTVILDQENHLIVVARDEIALRRETARLQDEQAVGETRRTGVIDLFTLEAAQHTAEDGVEAVERLLSSLTR